MLSNSIENTGGDTRTRSWHVPFAKIPAKDRRGFHPRGERCTEKSLSLVDLAHGRLSAVSLAKVASEETLHGQ